MDENMFDLGLDVATISAELPDPVITLSGADSYTVQGTADYPLLALSLYGKSVQDGTPTPDAPIDIVSVGDDENVEITACGKNLIEGSQDFSGTWIYPWATSEETYQNLVVKEHTGAWNGTAKKVYIKEGKTYTFSAYVKQSENDTITLYTIPSQSMNIANSADVSKHSLPISVTTEWQRFTHTFTCIKSGYAVPRVESSTSSTTVYICGFQLEESDLMTEYEPYKGNAVTITSGLPLCAVGNVRDELVYNADGTGKIIKRTGKHRLPSDVNWIWESGKMGAPYVLKPNTVNGTDAISDYFEKVRVFTSWIDVYTNDYADDVVGFKDFLANNNVYILYPLATPQEIELTAAEMAELQKLQSYEGTTNIYNDEQAEMLVKMLRSDYDMKYIEWLKESQTWTCPKAGKWKIICVGGGASGGSGGDAVVPTTAGGTTSFGSIVSASGAPSTKDYIKTSSPIDNIWVGAYGGWTGVNYGGTPAMAVNAGDNFGVSGAHTNGTLPSNFNPVCGIGYGAGGASAAEKSPIPGRAGSIESTIVDLEEGQVIMCTVGKGGQTTDATKMSSGADGVIVVQYLGY